MEQCRYSMEELAPVALGLARDFCGHEHSSVSYERAQALMEAVLYCVRELDVFGNNTLVGGKLSPMDAYLSGRQVVIQKFERMQNAYGTLMMDFEDYGVECLCDTVKKGILAFIRSYDVKYAPQETLLTLDYPVLADLHRLSGIDAVSEYVDCICLEQRFLKRMGVPYVRGLLLSCGNEYESAMDNICSIVTQDLAAHFLLDKPLEQAGISEREYLEAARLLSEKTLEEAVCYLETFLKNLIRRQYGEDEALFAYLRCTMRDFAVRMLERV